jgi:hypothetical protein
MIPNMYQTSTNSQNEDSFQTRIGLDEEEKIDLNQCNQNEELFEVEKIIDKKISPERKIFYLIKWVGFDESQMTWEPLDNLISVIEKIEEYEREEAQRSLKIPSINNLVFEEYDKELEQRKINDQIFLKQYAKYISSIIEVNSSDFIPNTTKEVECISISNSQYQTNFNSQDNFNITNEHSNFYFNNQNGIRKNSNSDYHNFDLEVKKPKRPQRAAKKTFFPNTNYMKTRRSFLYKLEYENDPQSLEKLFEKLNHKNYGRTHKNIQKNKKISDTNSEISKNSYSQFDEENKTTDTKLSNNFINLDSLNNLINKNSDVKDSKIDLSHDKPEKILLAKIFDSKLYFWVKWHTRPDGFEPNESLVPYKIIRNLFTDKLLEFYEDRLNLGQDKLSILKNGMIHTPTSEDRSKNSNNYFTRQTEISNTLNLNNDENLLPQNANLEILNNADLRIMSDIINQDNVNFLSNIDCYELDLDNPNLIIPS